MLLRNKVAGLLLTLSHANTSPHALMLKHMQAKTYADTYILSTHMLCSLHIMANCLHSVQDLYVNYHQCLNLCVTMLVWKLCFGEIQLNKHLTVYTTLLCDSKLNGVICQLDIKWFSLSPKWSVCNEAEYCVQSKTHCNSLCYHIHVCPIWRQHIANLM